MKRHIAILALFGALIYGTAAYTRPHEPAGRALHGLINGMKQSMPECPRVPFSGLLQLNDYTPRPMNSKEKLDSSSSQPPVDHSLHWENPRICATCIHYMQNRCNITAFYFSPNHPACPRYIAKKTD